MTLELLKTTVRNNIDEEKTEAALKVLYAWAKETGNQELKSDINLLIEDLIRLNRDSNLGLLPNSVAMHSQFQLRNKVLSTLSGLDIRYSDKPEPPSLSHLKILMLTATPAGTASLNLNREVRVIYQKLGTTADKVNLQVKDAVNTTEFRETIDGMRPHILHFSGHGENGEKGGIYVQNEDKNGAELLPTRSLSALFEFLKDDGIDLKAVLLNACYSDEQAQAISTYVLYVIGTTINIPDDAAVKFSEGFYYKLVESDFDYEKAFKFGRLTAADILEGDFKSYFVIYKNGQKLTI